MPGANLPSFRSMIRRSRSSPAVSAMAAVRCPVRGYAGRHGGRIVARVHFSSAAARNEQDEHCQGQEAHACANVRFHSIILHTKPVLFGRADLPGRSFSTASRADEHACGFFSHGHCSSPHFKRSNRPFRLTMFLYSHWMSRAFAKPAFKVLLVDLFHRGVDDLRSLELAFTRQFFPFEGLSAPEQQAHARLQPVVTNDGVALQEPHRVRVPHLAFRFWQPAIDDACQLLGDRAIGLASELL